MPRRKYSAGGNWCGVSLNRHIAHRNWCSAGLLSAVPAGIDAVPVCYRQCRPELMQYQLLSPQKRKYKNGL
jgi:hypothetical protein